MKLLVKYNFRKKGYNLILLCKYCKKCQLRRISVQCSCPSHESSEISVRKPTLCDIRSSHRKVGALSANLTKTSARLSLDNAYRESAMLRLKLPVLPASGSAG